MFTNAENHARREAWLKSLKPGDQVAIPRNRGGFYRTEGYTIKTVLRRTATQITVGVKDGVEHKYRAKNGSEICDHSRWSYHPDIEEVTDLVRKENARADLERAAIDAQDQFKKVCDLSTELLNQVITLSKRIAKYREPKDVRKDEVAPAAAAGTAQPSTES